MGQRSSQTTTISPNISAIRSQGSFMKRIAVIFLFKKLEYLFSSLLFCAMFFISPLGHADDVADAKAEFMRGVDFFSKERFEEAYVAFKVSYEMNPSLVVLYNIAMCEQILGHYAKSISSFQKFLKEGTDILHSEMLKNSKESIRKLMYLVGTLTLLNPPPGAAIKIDGKIIHNFRK